MFSVYFIMQMSNGCRLTWFKWVNSIFLFTLIIQTATKKKKRRKKKALQTKQRNLPLPIPTLPSSTAAELQGWGSRLGAGILVGRLPGPGGCSQTAPCQEWSSSHTAQREPRVDKRSRSGSAELALGTGTGGCAAQPGGLPVDMVLAARHPLPKGHCQNSCWRQRGQTGPLVANRSSSALPHGKVSCRAGQAARPGRLSKPQEAKKQPQPGRRLEILKPRASLASPPTDTGKLRDSNLEELTSCSQQPGGGSQSESEWQWYPHRRWAFISFHKCQTQKGAFFCGRERVIGCSAFPT